MRFAASPFSFHNGLMKLQRMTTTDAVTLGHFTDDENRQLWCTLELPDRGNQRSVSRIPAGRYVCKRCTSPKFGDCFEVTGVPNRANILIHWGNFTSDTEGCIIIGSSFADLNKDGVVDVAASKAAYLAFMRSRSDVLSFTLTVVD